MLSVARCLTDSYVARSPANTRSTSSLQIGIINAVRCSGFNGSSLTVEADIPVLIPSNQQLQEAHQRGSRTPLIPNRKYGKQNKNAGLEHVGQQLHKGNPQILTNHVCRINECPPLIRKGSFYTQVATTVCASVKINRMYSGGWCLWYAIFARSLVLLWSNALQITRSHIASTQTIPKRPTAGTRDRNIEVAFALASPVTDRALIVLNQPAL